jgi:hypothetical protein
MLDINCYTIPEVTGITEMVIKDLLKFLCDVMTEVYRILLYWEE